MVSRPVSSVKAYHIRLSDGGWRETFLGGKLESLRILLKLQNPPWRSRWVPCLHPLVLRFANKWSLLVIWWGQGLLEKVVEKLRGWMNADFPSSPQLLCSKACTWP